MSDIHFILNRRGKFSQILAEATITGDRKNQAIALFSFYLDRRPSPNGSGKGKADSTEVTRHKHTLPRFGFEVSNKTVSIVADIHGDHPIAWQQARQVAKYAGRI